MSVNPHTAITISTGAIRRNCESLSLKIGPAVDITFVAKSNAMGYGLIESTKQALRGGARRIAVSDVNDVSILRDNGITASIILLYHPLPDASTVAIHHGVTISISNPVSLLSLEKLARKLRKTVSVDLFFDTGMKRYGIDPNYIPELIRTLQKTSNIRVAGISSHFATSDSDIQFAKKQLTCFHKILVRLHPVINRTVRDIHIANSAAVELLPDSWNSQNVLKLYPNARMSVRIFRAVVGASPVRMQPPLEPAFVSFTSVVQTTQRVKKGEYIGYDKSYQAKRDLNVAIVPVGWANAGYQLQRGYVIVNNVKCPMVGFPSANALSFENLAGAKEGDIVYLVKQDGLGEQLTLQELAEINGITQTHITAALGAFNPRFYRE
ncbi:MAG: alanine racemase [Patescibacteria group bacterium]|nr:alanine racemase [Patescibacteria group bacterium]